MSLTAHVRWLPTLALAVLIGGAGCSSGASEQTTASTSTSEPTVTASSGTTPVDEALSCRFRGPLPDPVCTPGALDPRVNAGDIGSTICLSGWTTRVRPPESVTEPIKRERMRAYSVSMPLSSVELGHLVPISLGGATTTANLWPEQLDGPEGARVKDRLEDRFHALVCDGNVPLGVAQRAIAHDWVAAYPDYVGSIT